MKIALCILTLNEHECLKVIFPKLPLPSPVGPYDEVYALDGGSTDGTLEYYQDKGIKVIGQNRKGRGSAFLQAFSQIDADAFIFFSPDGNEDVNDLHKFRPLLEKGADIVIASRMMKGAVNEDDDKFLKWRKWANNAFNFLANIIFRRSGSFITDSINGYRAITKQAVSKLNLDAVDYTIEYQMTIRAFKDKLKIVEFPSVEGQRVSGETQARSIPTGVRFLQCLFREIIN
ncbi:Glyco_trans_2-like domain-containing protein [Gammaproteobacteria bacterium]